jgi:hypothetical protein
MILLTSTSQRLVVLPSSDDPIEVQVSYVETNSTSATEKLETTIVGLGSSETDILPAPASGFSRVVKSISCFVLDGPQLLKVQLRYGAGGNIVSLIERQLEIGDSLHYEDGRGWYVDPGKDALTVLAGRTSTAWKVGTGADTVGYWYCHAKDAGAPGAWAPGTPGMAGRVTDGVSAADAGCLPIVNAGAGKRNHITSLDIAATVAHFFQLVDLLWVNSGIVVTTTTAQTVNSVTLPARDVNGTSDGTGCIIGLLFVAAATNAAVINNATVSYTNSAGVAGRTATLANLVGAMIPTTPTIGTIVWFQLAAGDVGVRSIQSITLGTSLVTGTVSLVIARVIASASALLANVGSPRLVEQEPGIEVFNGSCLHLCYMASATTATTTTATATVQERAIA